MLFSPIIAFGATFCVDDEAELQAALTTAASNGEDDIVRIVQGTYLGNFLYASTEGNSLTVEGGYTEGCASREIDPVNTILDGAKTDMVLALVSQGAADFSVEGLTFQNGDASTVDDGGGLYAKTENGNVTLTNNTFSNNSAVLSGGGTYVEGSGTLINNTFSGNTASTSGGGAYVVSSSSLSNNTFSGNTAVSGGGAHVGNGSTLNSNTFSNNTASNDGGGAWVGSSSTLDNNTFNGNTANDVGGGAYVNGSGNLTNNTFSSNTASDDGGGGIG